MESLPATSPASGTGPPGRGPGYHARLETPLGWLAFSLGPAGVEALELCAGRPPLVAVPDPRAAGIREALAAYFAGARWPTGVPLAPAGTPFQRRVWRALGQIPAGGVRTYGELARGLGSSPRAVGGACRANPVPVLIPCHRVVACDGIGGFSGRRDGRPLEIKRWLLRHEGFEP